MQQLNHWVEDYLLYCKCSKGLDEKTLKAYQIDLRQFAAFQYEKESGLDRASISSYLAYLQMSFKVKTVKRKIASIKAFFNYLEYEEIIEENPFSKLRIKLHEPFLLPRTIPFSTIQKLLHHAYLRLEQPNLTEHQNSTVCRDIAVLELLFATGMRVSELCSLKKDSVNLADGIIKIYGKGSKERMIQIGNEDVLAALVRYHNSFSKQIEKTGCFFVNRCNRQLSAQSVRFMINKYCDIAGIALHITPHMFRHSFATLLLEEDVDIRYIQMLLGHSSIVTTQIYTHVTSKKQRDLLAAKHPRNKIHV